MTTATNPQLTSLQRRKLRRLLSDAFSNVPGYARLYDRAGLCRRDLSDPDVLAKLPILTKAALLDLPPDERLNARFDKGRLSEETTTGSTGQPLSVYVDGAYKRRRNLRFLRGLLAAGHRPWQSIMLLTDRPRPRTRPGWHYCSIEQPTERIAEAYLRTCPTTLYGFTTPLRLLAGHLEERQVPVPRPDRVITTAEMLTGATRDYLREVFGCPVVDFYGMTEMGLVAWQGAGTAEYTTSRAVITEFLPNPAGDGRYRMVMTNLDLRACPLIRFDSGDIASVEQRHGNPVITGLEGRAIDSILCRDGSELSPYRVTVELQGVSGLRRFKVTQRSLLDFVIATEIDASMRDPAKKRIEAIFRKLVGDDAALDFEFTDKLIPDGAVKFRPVESLATRC